jgi:hypothetical protein
MSGPSLIGSALLLELSREQVELVRGHAARWGNMQALLSEGEAHPEVLAAAYREILRGPGAPLCSSLVAGLVIYAVLPCDGTPVANAELARVLGMNSSTTHRYLITLVAVGLVERTARTRRYRLAR